MDLYLIAHKVRGEPAFDVAERMECAICLEAYEVTGSMGCDECDGEGFWWIIGTSGHRAYPYWNVCITEPNKIFGFADPIPSMPPSLPDHYPTRQAKPEKSSGKSLLAALGLLPKVQRRL